MHSNKTHGLGRLAAGLAMAGFATVAFSATAASATAGSLPPPEVRFQQERAACLNGSSHQDRETCLKEARNALAEARKRPATSGPEDWRSNALARCERVPQADRAACETMALGGGKVSGSVEGGGVLKEVTTITVGPPVVLIPVEPKNAQR